MKSIPIASFRPGMYFEKNVYLDDDFILLSPEVPVTEELVRSLGQWGFTEVFTEGNTSGKVVGTDGKAGILQSAILDHDIKEQEGRRKAKHFYKDLLAFTEQVYQRFRTDNSLNLRNITEKIKEAIEMIKENEQYVLRFSDFDTQSSDYLVSHSVKTTILALSLGIDLPANGGPRIPPHKLIELGICALLHEVGMLRIPSQIYQKKGALTDKEKQLITAHPLLGFNLLKSHTLPQDILLGVLQHHERNSGVGYPQRLKEEHISLFGKIVGIACSYIAQISDRPFRGSKDGHSSLMDLLSNMQNLYDRTILNTLLMNLSVYPIGCHVRLSNNCIGVVVSANEKNPKFPAVKLLIDDHNNQFNEQPVVDTGEYDELHVKSVLNDQDVKKLVMSGLLSIP